MSNLTNISTAIKNVLVGINQASSSAFADVTEYPTNQFSGTPAASVVPSDNAADYSTIVQDRRTYAFTVTLFEEIETTGGGTANVFTDMRTLVDTVLDAFTNSNDLSNACDFLRPVPSAWGVVELESGLAVAATITLHCEKDVQTNN